MDAASVMAASLSTDLNRHDAAFCFKQPDDDCIAAIAGHLFPAMLRDAQRRLDDPNDVVYFAVAADSVHVAGMIWDMAHTATKKIPP